MRWLAAHGAEKLCKVIREEIASELTNMDPVAEFIHLLSTKSPQMPNFLNHVWFGMPESCEVRSCPAFGVLCDLCSEGYCVQDETDVEE